MQIKDEVISLSPLGFFRNWRVEGSLCGRGDEMAKDTPDPLKPAHIPGQNPATPERMPGHTGYYEKEEVREAPKGPSHKPKRGPRNDPRR
jgi:hypothetical protein